MKQQFVTPIGDRILARPAKAISNSLVIVPEAHEAPPQIFQVVRLGTKRKNDEPFEVEVGDRVVLGAMSGKDVKVDGEMCKIVTSDEIIAVYRP
jgi:chaperonin GroES